jgi:hypothetical protein
MRRYRKRIVCLFLVCGMLPAFFLKCDKASLNLQRGFWQGLGYNVSALLTQSAEEQQETNP